MSKVFAGLGMSLGSGVRLFDGVSPDLGLVPTRVVDSPRVTHLTYRITRS
ncbi:hypothetical protein M8Z33_13945 [Streptomyces sp. ZAF1911]|nr:hypothetical protein [Streptomyces sp. ZAF1911]MDD9377741.1 hypothetical protein [Streptomyces sp. ZAF1911]